MANDVQNSADVTPVTDRGAKGMSTLHMLIFAGLFVLAVMGIAMYQLMALIENRTTRWAHRSGLSAG